MPASALPVTRGRHDDRLPVLPSTSGPPRPFTRASAPPPGLIASAVGLEARPWEMSPVDHERPASAVEMSGVKVNSWEGRTPDQQRLARRGKDEPAVGGGGGGLDLVGPGACTVPPEEQLPKRVGRLSKVAHRYRRPGPPATLDRGGEGRRQGRGCWRAGRCTRSARTARSKANCAESQSRRGPCSRAPAHAQVHGFTGPGSRRA